MRRWRGLPLQLLFFTILPLTLLLLLIAFGSLGLHQQAMRTMVGMRDERATRAAASAISEQLNHRMAAALSLALRASNTSPEHVLADAAFLLNDYEGGLALFTNVGNLLATTDETPTWEKTIPALWADTPVLSEVEVAVSSQSTSAIHLALNSEPREEIAFAVAQTTEGITAVGAFYPATLAQQTLDKLKE